MAPARGAKKRRVETAADASTSTSSAASTKDLLAQSDGATSALSALLDDMEAIAASSSSSSAAGSASSSSKLPSLLTDASLSLLTLKATQRSLCRSVESDLLRTVVAARRSEVGSKALEYQNLVYERHHLRGRVRECRDFHGGQLAKMARDELGGRGTADADDAAAAASTSTTSHVDREKEDERIINAFLSGGDGGAGGNGDASSFDHRDPSHHGHTLSHLKSELTLRRTQEAELTRARAELEHVKKQCASRKAFLGTLPRKLREVERSTGPLQNFFREAVGAVSAGIGSAKSNSGKDDVKPTLLIGTDRSARIEAARTLPEPLYTVFWQLTGYVDAFGIGGDAGSSSASKMLKVDVLEENHPSSTDDGANATASPGGWIVRHPKTVALTVPAPDIDGLSSTSSSSGGPVTIKFRYLPRLGLVTATATASGTNGLGEGRTLLAGLFPNDDGTTLPSCAAPFLLGDNSGVLTQVEEALQKRGDLPYSWCQYVAGLIFPPQPDTGNGGREEEGFDEDDDHYDDIDGEDGIGQSRYSHHIDESSYSTDQPPKRGAIEPSTRSVVRSLSRRIRARAALTSLLNTLGRGKTPPLHSALDAKSGAEESSSTSSRLTSWKECTGADKSCKYYAASIKRGSDGSSLKATVKIDPAYPAVPPLWSLQDATAGLNDDGDVGAAAAEGAYDDPAMGAIEDAINADLATLVVDGVEETYDWILSAQLARLLECLDRPADGDNESQKKSAVSYDLYSKGL